MVMSMISGSPAPQGIPAHSLMGGVVASLKCWWVVWSGEHAFTLADEAKRAIALIDGSEGKVHLVGHSYGGGVALHAALARPARSVTGCWACHK
jgi:pimeloyl-ACP methyl ester carboxylesterase